MCSKRSVAKAVFINSSWDGLAIAMVRPSLIAMVRNAAFTNDRSGNPKDILDSPQIVANPFCLQ